MLRVLNEGGIRVRDLPLLSGVSKEGIAMALGVLRKQQMTAMETRVVRWTPQGLHAQATYRKLLATVEQRWRERYGAHLIRSLRYALEPLTDRFFLGLEPYPEGWRAHVKKPQTLPHFPMLPHRGGYPDGS